ncbi:hypothetical protein GCM10009819_20320 [Agromyces tropicus]|uniref:Glyoxalase-like domain-containing protein n=1 Tax=Agromyces tropicus TaxID=555371 RepID=A0ABN2UEW9_9MICO
MGQEQRLAFLAVEGLDDWRVAYCGPIARFATGSVRAGAAFAAAVAELDELAGHPPLVDVRPDGVIVRIVADLAELDDGAAERARAISAVARAQGLTADPGRVQDVQVAVATRLPIDEVLPFWRAVLGYADHVGDDLVDPLGRMPSIWFQPLDPAKPLRHAMHLDLSMPREVASARLAATLAAGGRLAFDAEAPQYWTCADAAGNKVDLVTWPDLPVPEDAPASLDVVAIPRAGARDGATRPDMAQGPVGASPERRPRVAAGPGDLEHGEAMWMAFRAASDLVDWPIVSWGPTAWFRTGSLAASAALARDLADLAGSDRMHLDLRADGIAVRLARDESRLVEADLALARRVSETARAAGARSDPSMVQTVQIAIASKADDDVRPAWRELFDYAELGTEDLVDPDGRGPGLWFQELPAEKPLRHAFHLDVSVPRPVGRARVAAAVRAGGRIAAGSEATGWWTLADPAGNKADISVWADRADGVGRAEP